MRTTLWLTALALLAPIPAAADAAVESYGGGAVPPAPIENDLRRLGQSVAIGLSTTEGGGALRARVAITLPCTGDPDVPLGGDDLLLRVPLAGDGSFTGSASVRSDELGRATVRLAGRLTGDDAAGTVRVVSRRGKLRCASGVRAWRAVRVGAPGTPGAARAGALLLGVTGQRASIPHGLVVRVSDDGTRAWTFTSFITTCRTSDVRRPQRVDYQSGPRPVTLGAPPAVVLGRTVRETASSRRRGVRRRDRLDLKATLDADGRLTGTLEHRSSYRDRSYRERCTMPAVPVSAALRPAG